MIYLSITILALAATAALAQPGQLAPVQPSLSMQDGNLKPALPGALQGVGIDQKLDRQIPLDLVFRDEAGRRFRSPPSSTPASPCCWPRSTTAAPCCVL